MLLTNISTEALVTSVKLMKDEEINAYLWSAVQSGKLFYCFHQAHGVIHQSVVLVCLLIFYGLKTLYHNSKCHWKSSVPGYGSTTLCPCVLQIVQVNEADNFQRFVSACAIYSARHWAFPAEREWRWIWLSSGVQWGGASKGKANRGGREICAVGEEGEEASAQCWEVVWGGKMSNKFGNLMMIWLD